MWLARRPIQIPDPGLCPLGKARIPTRTRILRRRPIRIPDPDTEADPDPGTEADPDPDTEADPDPDTEADPDPDSGTGLCPKPRRGSAF